MLIVSNFETDDSWNSPQDSYATNAKLLGVMLRLTIRPQTYAKNDAKLCKTTCVQKKHESSETPPTEHQFAKHHESKPTASNMTPKAMQKPDDTPGSLMQ